MNSLWLEVRPFGSPTSACRLRTALFQTLVQLGGSFGLALTTVIASSYRTKALDAGKDAVRAQLTALHAAFWLAAGCSFAALAVALIALRGMGTIGKTKTQQAH